MPEGALVTALALILAVLLDLWLVRRRWRGRRTLPGAETERAQPAAASPLSQAKARLPLLAAEAARRFYLASRLKLGLEMALIVGVALLYTFPLLDFDARRTLPGEEYEVHVGTAALFTQWLAGETEFPLWNPIIWHGRSLIADPFLFVFNPFASLPMGLMGVVNGSKAAVLLHFMLAGLGAWLLCRRLAFERITRLWCSLTYMMSGAIAAHLFAGQLQLAFALGWLPWSMAGLLWVIEDGSARALVLSGLAQALFFFTGNYYYQLYALVCMGIIAFAYTIRLKPLRLEWGVTGRALRLGLFSLGLIAIQFLPQAASLGSIRNLGGYVPGDTSFYGSQTPEYALLNFLVPGIAFSQDPSFDKAPFVQESYRYIGVTPFLLLVMLIPAFRRGRRRLILALLACVLMLLAWTNIRDSFFQTIYQLIPFLNQFRWPGRALSVAGLLLILLGGVGLDELLRRLRAARGRLALLDDQAAIRFGIGARHLLVGSTVAGLALSLGSELAANRDLLYVIQNPVPEVDAGIAWLRSYDPAEYFVHASPGVARVGALEAYAHGLRVVDITDGWIPADPVLFLGPPDAVTPQPKYQLLWDLEPMDDPQASMVRQFKTLKIWRMPDGFPYAFLVPADRLADASPPLESAEVAPADQVWREGANRIVVQASAESSSILVIAEAWFTGWRVRVGDADSALESVSGLLAVALPHGRHTIVFEYDPLSFKLGAVASGLTLVFGAGLMVHERRRAVRRRAGTAAAGYNRGQ